MRSTRAADSGKLLRELLSTIECPNCGASLSTNDLTDAARCRFCGTHVVIPRHHRLPSRARLEEERAKLLARDQEWNDRIKRAKSRGVEDIVIPPVGCCGIYFLLFVIGSLILGAIGLKESKEHGLMVATIAIVASVVGVIAIIVRRESNRRERIVLAE